MTEMLTLLPDTIGELVNHCLGSFALGFAASFIITTLKKFSEKV